MAGDREGRGAYGEDRQEPQEGAPEAALLAQMLGGDDRLDLRAVAQGAQHEGQDRQHEADVDRPG